MYHLRADHHPDYVPALARCSTPEKRLIVSADEKLTAFLELERVTHDDSDRNQTATVWLGLAVSNGPPWMLHVLFNSPASK